MKKRFENLEEKYFGLIERVNQMQEKQEKPNPQYGNKWMRCDMQLAALEAVKFNPQFGYQ